MTALIARAIRDRTCNGEAVVHYAYHVYTWACLRLRQLVQFPDEDDIDAKQCGAHSMNHRHHTTWSSRVIESRQRVYGGRNVDPDCSAERGVVIDDIRRVEQLVTRANCSNSISLEQWFLELATVSCHVNHRGPSLVARTTASAAIKHTDSVCCVPLRRLLPSILRSGKSFPVFRLLYFVTFKIFLLFASDIDQ